MYKLSQTKPTLWLRYVHDTFVLWRHGRDEPDHFLTHINSLRPSIDFTMEIEDNRLPFLDTEVVRDPINGAIHTMVYRKPTHTDRYILFNSYHHPQIKTSVIRTIMRRGERVCSQPMDLEKEKEHIREAFIKINGYPARFVNRALNSMQRRQQVEETETTDEPITTITIPGTSERIRRVLQRSGIRTAFKTMTTIRSLLKTKPATDDHSKRAVIYRITCQDCHKCTLVKLGAS